MKKLLLQLDPGKHPSAFDRIVAYDAGADDVQARRVAAMWRTGALPSLS